MVARHDGCVGAGDQRAKFLRNVFASGHINVLLGSAFSVGVVPTLGKRESWFQSLDEKLRGCPGDGVWGCARGLLRAEYFRSVMLPLRGVRPYASQLDFIAAVANLVSKRGTTTIPKRVNFFTTNYDPMIELSLEELGLPFNDGFSGRMNPVLDPSTFSRLMCEQSLFMEYTSQVMTANVLKSHGSLTWRKTKEGGIAYSNVDDILDSCYGGFENVVDSSEVDEVARFVGGECDENGLNSLCGLAAGLSADTRDAVNRFAATYDSTLCIVNPAKRKFEETVLEQSYYDLLRIYANELDRNNALLLVFGFSFADEHILELTKRALRSNPKLIVLISCHTENDAEWYSSLFRDADTVHLLVPEEGEMRLNELTKVLQCVVR